MLGAHCHELTFSAAPFHLSPPLSLFCLCLAWNLISPNLLATRHNSANPPPPLPLPLPAHCLLPLQHERRNDPQRHLLIKLFVKRLKHMPHANAYALQTRTVPLPLPLSIPHHVNDKWLSVCQLPLALQLLPRQLPLNNRTNGCKGIWRTKSFRRKTKIELRKKSSDGATRGGEEGVQVCES